MGRASPRAPKVRRADDALVAVARRAALVGELDNRSATRLFLSGGDVGTCGSSCHGNPKRVDCVCGLVPPPGGYRRSGLWGRDTEVIVQDAVGVDPTTLARTGTDTPCGLLNLGNTCYVAAALQCLFSIREFRGNVFVLNPGFDQQEGAVDTTVTHTPTDTTLKINPTAALRKLFASMQNGHRAACDPTDFANALSLETAAQQDGQEFLKLLLAYVANVAEKGMINTSSTAGTDDTKGTGDEKRTDGEEPVKETFVKRLFCGQYTYATTCAQCGRASEHSARPVDFYELELNVGFPTFGDFRGDAVGASESIDIDNSQKASASIFGLRDSLKEFLTVETLDGENRYRCETCSSLQDATRAVTIKTCPKFLVCQLKRFVFDFETFERRKKSDAFQFPRQIDMGRFLEKDDVLTTLDGRPAAPPKNDEYELTSILLHRGQNATSGHYVALVKDETARGAFAATGAREKKQKKNESDGDDWWWRFDDEQVTALRGGPFGVPVAVETSVSGQVPAMETNGTDLGCKKGKGEKAKGKNKNASAPRVPKDGDTLTPGSYASSDAYLLVYKRVGDGDAWDAGDADDPGTRVPKDTPPPSGDVPTPLPFDLARAVAGENETLLAMAQTFREREVDAKASIETRRRNARAVAETARAPCLELEWDGNGDADSTEHPSSVPDTSEYRFVPRAWLAAFCDASLDPGPVDFGPITCAHGFLDPTKPDRVVRISLSAFTKIAEVSGFADTDANADAQTVCRACLKSLSTQLLGENESVSLRADARSGLDVWEKKQKEKEKMSEDTIDIDLTPKVESESKSENDSAVWVSAVWLKKWRAWKTVGSPPRSITSESPTSAITCVHFGLKPNANAVRIGGKTWAFLVTNPPAAADCGPAGDSADAAITIDGDHEERKRRQSRVAVGANGSAQNGGRGGGGDARVTHTNAPTLPTPNDNEMKITGEIGGSETCVRGDASFGASETQSSKSSKQWLTFSCRSSVPCAQCVSTKEDATTDKHELRVLIETHRGVCGALRQPFDADTLKGTYCDSAHVEEIVSPTQARFRVVPTTWVLKWRALVFPTDSRGAGNTPDRRWRPTLQNLTSAVAELVCSCGLSSCTAESLWRAGGDGADTGADEKLENPLLETLKREKTKALTSFFGDEPVFGKYATSGSAIETLKQGRKHELIPNATFQLLEEVLGGTVAAPGCFYGPEKEGVRFFPETCQACVTGCALVKDPFAENKESVTEGTPFFEAKISVRRVRVDPFVVAKQWGDREVAARVSLRKKQREKKPDDESEKPASISHLPHSAD